MTGEVAGADRFDLVLTGGTVIDPASGLHQPADVALEGGRVAQIGPGLAARGGRTIDCRGAFVTPGLIDCHTHIFDLFTTLGAPVDEACFQRGVTVAVDGGSSGAWTFPAFERYVVRPAAARVLCFLNIAAAGILDMRAGELRLLDHIDEDAAVATAARHPDIVRGFKVRLGEHMTGGSCLPALRRARAIGDAAGLPLMLHVGGTEEPLAEILEYLRPGDIVSHCYTGQPHGILDGDAVAPAVRAARRAGVLFDSAHGAGNLSFAVARRAVAEGFLPDAISSDNSRRNWRGPVFDLATTMSKFLALGLTLDQVIERVTARPAAMLGIAADGAGRIAAGGPADLTVLRLTDEPYELRDAVGESMNAPRLEPLWTVRGGEATQCAAWRGEDGVAVERR
jgi:dihydroorotase